jgi:hypothetical protein
MSDFIEHADDAFADQVETFTDYVMANAATLKVTPTEATALDAVRLAYKSSLESYADAAVAANVLCRTKDTNRAAAESLLRAYNKRFQADSAITAAQKTALRLNVPDGTRTRAAAPTTQPVATIISGGHLRHLLNYRDTTMPGTKARPAGVIGAEIWGAITAQGAPAPAVPDGYHMLAQDRSPHLCEHEAEDTGKTAYYILRWVNTHSEKGPWSDAVSATIA